MTLQQFFPFIQVFAWFDGLLSVNPVLFALLASNLVSNNSYANLLTYLTTDNNLGCFEGSS